MIETPEFADMLARMMVEVRRAFDQAVLEAVRGMREAGCSWREVAEGLGTTRQSAQMTYGRRRADTGAA